MMEHFFKLASPLIVSVPILMTGLDASDAAHELRSVIPAQKAAPSCGCSAERSVIKAQEPGRPKPRVTPLGGGATTMPCVPVPEDQACYNNYTYLEYL